MFKNYLLTAWKVLMRRKVFSFISLFGISITLAILLILSTILDNFLYPLGPEKSNQNFLSINRLTITSKDGDSNWSSRPGYKFLAENVARLKSPEKTSFFTSFKQGTSFISGEKINNYLRRTDASYWQILDFDFTKGRAFTEEEFNSGTMVAVISETTAKELFAEQEPLRQSFVVNNQTFQVIGVVKDISFFENIAFSDIWVPYTTAPSTSYKAGLTSGWGAILYHSNKNMLKEIQSEYINLLKEDFISPDPENYHTAVSGADTPIENLARNIINSKTYKSDADKLIALFIVFVVAFMLLPSINLINLNISRIMERSSEIGVRKAFGASSSQLVLQFIIENIVITAIGGLIGLLISWFVLVQIEINNLIPGGHFQFSLNTYLYGFSMIFVFGLISGAYPAYKMSKLHPVAALKGGA